MGWPEAIRLAAERLRVQREGLEGVARFYEQRGLLVDVDGVGEIDAVTERLRAALDRVSSRAGRA